MTINIPENDKPWPRHYKPEPKLEDFNKTTVQLFALRGIINMHMRAEKAGVACKLNGERATFHMASWYLTDISEADHYTRGCGTMACLGGSACVHPYFIDQGLTGNNYRSFFDFPEIEGLFFNRYLGNKGRVRRMYGRIGLKAKAPQVRQAIDKCILKYGGKEALKFAKGLEVLGDKLRLGIV